MGIVTWASMRCEILPSLEEPYMVGSAKLEQLLELAGWLIRLRMVNECFILNNVNLAAIFAKKWLQDYQNLKDILPPWTIFYNVAGYELYPEERVQADIGDITDITQRMGLEAGKAVGAISAVEILKTVQQPCEQPYWKLRYKGGCEDIFFLTINDKVEKHISVMNDNVGKAGYPPSDLGVYLQPVAQGTGMHCEFNLFYDPANPVEYNRVKTLGASAVKDLLNTGAFFSRPYGESANMVFNRDAATVIMLKKLKQMFDSNQIMNPGKICF